MWGGVQHFSLHNGQEKTLLTPKAESYRGANTNTQSTFFDDTLEFSNLIVTADEHADFEFYVKWVMGP